MKIVLRNTDVVLSRQSVTREIKFSDFTSEEKEVGILKTATGTVQPISDFKTTTDLQAIPVGAISVAPIYTNYNLVDYYCTCCIYDANGNVLAGTSDTFTLDLTQYPTAFYFKMSCNDATAGSGKLTFVCL